MQQYINKQNEYKTMKYRQQPFFQLSFCILDKSHQFHLHNPHINKHVHKEAKSSVKTNPIKNTCKCFNFSAYTIPLLGYSYIQRTTDFQGYLDLYFSFVSLFFGFLILLFFFVFQSFVFSPSNTYAQLGHLLPELYSQICNNQF